MKLTIPRGPLHAALTQAARVVERRNTIPIVANVRLATDGDRLRLTATDLDLVIRLSVEAAVEAAGATTVSAHLLAGLVGKYEADRIEIETVDDGAGLSIRAGRSRSRLHCLPAEDFPDFSDGEPSHRFALAAADLVAAIDGVAFAISTEETRYYLNGVHLTASETVDGVARLTAVATDGHRLSRWRAPLPTGAEGMPGVIVPRKTVGEIRRIADEGRKRGDDLVSIALSESKIRFEVGDTVLASKLIDGTFPDYARVIPRVFESEEAVERAALIGAIERVSTVASGRDRPIKCVFGAGELRLEATNPDAGSASETLTTTTEGEAGALEIGFNGGYLRSAAEALSSETIVFRLPDHPGSPTVIVPVPDTIDGQDWLAVLMPMRV